MSEGTEAHVVEDFVSGHTEINNGSGIWSGVGLIPKDHGFPTVYFLDICTDYVLHFTCLYSTEPTPVVSGCVVPQTLRLCPPELIVYSIHQFSWSIFMSQTIGMTHSFFPFILSWHLHWSLDAPELLWRLPSYSEEQGLSLPASKLALLFRYSLNPCFCYFGDVIFVCWLFWEQLYPQSSFGEHR